MQSWGAHACGPLQVGPASGKLATKPLEDWTAREVADTVLQDRWAFQRVVASFQKEIARLSTLLHGDKACCGVQVDCKGHHRAESVSEHDRGGGYRDQGWTHILGLRTYLPGTFAQHPSTHAGTQAGPGLRCVYRPDASRKKATLDVTVCIGEGGGKRCLVASLYVSVVL